MDIFIWNRRTEPQNKVWIWIISIILVDLISLEQKKIEQNRETDG